MPASSPFPPLLIVPVLLLLAPRGAGAAAGAVGVSGGGQLWCVAKNNAEDGPLQSAIDWACSADGGRADCAAIQQGGACYDPPDLQAHASYAFNDYFLRAGGAVNPAACDFSGAAALTALNPSHGSCVFPSSASPKNGSFTGTTTYGRTGADLSYSSSWKLNFWSWLLHIFLSVLFSAATHLL
ncbi:PLASMODESMATA CALLOSE-BINDING PROTEIN 5-like [Phragmites australis]|uniref:PLASMODESMATA CALLOSE-BINDING PROTEIN 5-like n=1 Tax=Phragmites australis TaxID=29695 RepID=UPI002D783B78|nr:PLASMODESMATA CALLOSE-BINDING PROTEIN 5-like [Phragmites australis]